MRPRPLAWFVVSLLLFVAAAFFWHLGEERQKAARSKSTPAGNSNVISGATATGVVSRALPAADSLNSAASSVAHVGSVLYNPTNPFAYRLTNTAKTAGQLLRDDHGLVLRNALLDTANPQAPSIPGHLRSEGEPGSYIVQARGAITHAFRNTVIDAGAEVVSYIPNNAMLVVADEAQARALRSSPAVQAVLPFEPYYKLDNALLPVAVEQQLSPYGQLNVVAFPGKTEQARRGIERAGGVVVNAPERTPFGENLTVKLPAENVAKLAQIPEVQMVAVRGEKRLMNDLTRVKLNVSTNTITLPSASHHLDLIGRNVLVGIVDSGVDEAHEDLAGRIWGLTTDTADGHGTHVAGTILGNGSQWQTVPSPDGTNSAAQGSLKDAVFSGMAPGATGYVHYYRGSSDIELQENVTKAGALISNNSWAYENNDYDIFAASYDAAVRDSLSGVPGQQQMTYVFAAGNSGSGDNGGMGAAGGSILSPATGKNVITVGASELLRNITNLVWKCSTNSDGTTTCETNAPWIGMTDSSSQVAGYSARGNVGIGREGEHGRFKPDVIAPGTMVVSTRNSNFQPPGGSISIFENRYNFQVIAPARAKRFSIGIPQDCVAARIFVQTNDVSAPNLTNLFIRARMDALPSGAPLGQDDVTINRPNISAGTLFFSVSNPAPFEVNYDVIVQLSITNDMGNYWEVLRDLNDQLGSGGDPKYRYETGTSMAAGAVSGVLALMQEFYAKTFSATNSPALNKALLVNGARSLSVQYSLDPNAAANHQGWGLVNVSNSIPAGLANTADRPLHFYEQSTNTALATGDAQVYTITVPPRARSVPLRVTLAWTDPAGNPVSGPKLVNDLDLYVDGPGVVFIGTNAVISTNRWIGNNFSSASDFTTPITLADTNGASSGTNVSEMVQALRDSVNNVENVYIAPPLGESYRVVVRGHRVNVNAVNSHTNGIVQDYALVISSGNTVSSNTVLSASGPIYTNDAAPFVTAMQKNGATNGIALLNQRVGANSPYLATTNGTNIQWSFYTFTNLTTFTNVSILTFMAPNLGFLRPDRAIDPNTPRHQQGDIDLYVARGMPAAATLWDLTNLTDAAVAGTDRSTRRGGTEFVLYSNAQPGEVFLIGVKSEDQQAATFGIFAIATQNPLNRRDESNNIVAEAVMLPVNIPDGSPDLPAATNLFVFVTDPEVTVQRLYVTNTITHENAGDLFGILSHNDPGTGTEAVAVLNNHRYWFDTGDFLYDDSDQGDLVGSIRSDGPGTLNDFVGHQAMGMWNFTIVDNALFHTGRVDRLTLVIEPASTNKDFPIAMTRTIGARGWLRAGFDVDTPDITNIQACVAFDTGGPVNLYLRRGQFPTMTEYDKALTGINPPGDCMDLGLNDSPPLSIGRYFVAVYNDSDAQVTVRLTVRLDRGFDRLPPMQFENGGTLPLVDDAYTNSTITVTTQAVVTSVEADVRLDHPRASDLVLYLVNPQGTRVMLAENRGRDIAKGYGHATTNVVMTNFGVRLLDDSFEGINTGAGPKVFTVGNVFSGWTNEVGTVEVTSAFAHTGTNALDLNGTEPGTISTNIATIPGRSYLLTFAYSKDPAIGIAPSADILMNGERITNVVYTGTGGTPTSMNWSNGLVRYNATGIVTTVTFASVTPGTDGLVLDTIRMDQVTVLTNGTLYATFTEDATRLPAPIKFAPPPFGDTNFTGTNIFISGFEFQTNRINGLYTNAEAFVGWTVTSNKVYVVSNSVFAYSDTNFLLLRTGIVARTIPTIAGKEYVLQFATRTDGRLIYNTGVDGDNIPLELGTLDSHYRVVANSFNLASSNTYALTTGAMLSTWLNWTNGESRWIGVDANAMNIPEGGARYRTVFDLRGYDLTSVQLNGRLATDEDDALLEVYLNGAPIGAFGGAPNLFQTLNIDSARPFVQRWNTLDFVVTNSTPGPYAFRFEPIISGTLQPDAVPRTYTANGRVRLIGSYTNDFVAQSGGWRMQTVTFVAHTNDMVLEFEGITPGVWLDHVVLRDTGRKYYLPEEPMARFLGKQAQGDWSLEIWDSRLGQELNSALLSWRLNLTVVRTNPPFTVLRDTDTKAVGGQQPVTTTVPDGGAQYFVVNVPCDAATVDLSIAAASARVNVVFNQDTFPTPGAIGNVLLTNGVGSWNEQLEIGFYPLLRSGPFYLAVTNFAPGADVAFTIAADVVCEDVPKPAGLVVGTSGFGPSGMKMHWTSEPTAEFKVLYATDPAGPWLEMPGTVTSSTGSFSFTDDGSTSGGLPSHRFYRLVRTK